MESTRPQFHAHCFDKKLAAKSGYGAFLPALAFIFGLVGLGFAAWYIGSYEIIGVILCVAGLFLFILSLVMFSRRRAVQLTAFAVSDDKKLYRAKRSGYRGLALFAAGELPGELADALLNTTYASDIGGLIGSVAGMAAVSKLKKAMATPSVIETMLTNPNAVTGAGLLCIDSISDIKETSDSYVLRASGTNIKNARPFTDKKIRLAKAYTEPDALYAAMRSLA